MDKNGEHCTRGTCELRTYCPTAGVLIPMATVFSDPSEFAISSRKSQILTDLTDPRKRSSSVPSRRSLGNKFAIRTYHAYNAHRSRLGGVHEHLYRQYEKCLIYFAVTGMSLKPRNGNGAQSLSRRISRTIHRIRASVAPLKS